MDIVKTVKVATVTFTYVESHCRATEYSKIVVGKLLRSNDEEVPICIDMGSFTESDAFLNSFSHKSYLPIKLFTDIAPFTILHQRFGCTMVEYLRFLKSDNILPTYTYKFPNHTDENPNTYTCLLDEYRLITKDLVDFICDLHFRNKSLINLGIENLCMLNSHLRVWGIRFREADVVSRKNDFKFVFDVVSEILDVGGFDYKALPPDFDKLLDMMFGWSESSPIKTHLGLLSAKEKLSFFRNLGNFRHGFSHQMEQNLRRAMTQLKGCYSGWKDKVTWGPMLECLNYKGSNRYVDDDCYYNVNCSLMTYCRNAASHLDKYISKSICHNWTIDSEDIECYIMQHHSDFLIDLKNALEIEYITYIFE